MLFNPVPKEFQTKVKNTFYGAKQQGFYAHFQVYNLLKKRS
jgi:hypothetical protein